MIICSQLFLATILLSTITIAQVSDRDVDTDDPIKLEDHFGQWNASDTIEHRVIESARIVALEVAGASVMASSASFFLKHPSLAVDANAFEKFSTKFRSKKLGFAAVAAGIYLVVDATVGTVMAMRGNRPLVLLNSPALAAYLARTTLAYNIRHEDSSPAIRKEFELLNKAIFGAPLTARESLQITDHFETWTIADSKVRRLTAVATVDAIGIGAGIMASNLGRHHAAYVGAVREHTLGELSPRDLKALKKSEKFGKRLRVAGKVTAAYFVLEVVSGTVIAIRGNQPVYVGNFPGLASYLYKKEAAQSIGIEPEKDSFQSRVAENLHLKGFTSAADRELLQAIYAEAPELPAEAPNR